MGASRLLAPGAQPPCKAGVTHSVLSHAQLTDTAADTAHTGVKKINIFSWGLGLDELFKVPSDPSHSMINGISTMLLVSTLHWE